MRRSFEFCRFGAKDALDLTVPDVPVSSVPLSSARLIELFDARLLLLSALVFLAPALGLRLTVDFSAVSGATKVPGPTDFLGALGAGFVLLKEFGGKWLWRLPRSIEVVGAMESDLTELRELFEAVELLRVTGVTPDPFLDGIGIAACEIGFFCSIAGVSVGRGAATGLPRPGKGKWLRLGPSVPTMVSWKSSKLKVGSRKSPKSRGASLPSCG